MRDAGTLLFPRGGLGCTGLEYSPFLTELGSREGQCDLGSDTKYHRDSFFLLNFSCFLGWLFIFC